MGWVINIYFMPVCRVVKTVILWCCELHDALFHVAKTKSASGRPEYIGVITLTILQTGIKITVY